MSFIRRVKLLNKTAVFCEKADTCQVFCGPFGRTVHVKPQSQPRRRYVRYVFCILLLVGTTTQKFVGCSRRLQHSHITQYVVHVFFVQTYKVLYRTINLIRFRYFFELKSTENNRNRTTN